MSFTRTMQNGFRRPDDIPKDDPGRHSRDGWTCIADHSSVQLQGKQYRNMKEWARACAVCGVTFSVYERSGAVDANSRFSSKTCEAHRKLLAAVEKGYLVWSAALNGMIAGPACVGSAADINAELEQLRMANKIMKEELDGFYHKKLPWE